MTNTTNDISSVLPNQTTEVDTEVDSGTSLELNPEDSDGAETANLDSGQNSSSDEVVSQPTAEVAITDKIEDAFSESKKTIKDLENNTTNAERSSSSYVQMLEEIQALLEIPKNEITPEEISRMRELNEMAHDQFLTENFKEEDEAKNEIIPTAIKPESSLETALDDLGLKMDPKNSPKV